MEVLVVFGAVIFLLGALAIAAKLTLNDGDPDWYSAARDENWGPDE